MGFSLRLRREISSPCVGFSGRTCFFSQRREKKRLPASAQLGTSVCILNFLFGQYNYVARDFKNVNMPSQGYFKLKVVDGVFWLMRILR
ncbi:hypothetical protein BHM03_00002967 [Ensete ventricosum]|nr:hypothetical protein BHM03_00002967 [Ensete ventricosum]